MLTTPTGSFGAPPTAVLDYAQKLTNVIERNPDLFLRALYQQKLIDVRAKLAKLINADTDEVVLVTNATVALNTILRNLSWRPEDVIIICRIHPSYHDMSLIGVSPVSTTYSSVSRTAEYISHVHPHPTLSTVDLRFPTTHTVILQQFQEHVRAIKNTSTGRVVAIIDTLISNPGYLLPWQEMVRICQGAGILSVVDAAHSIGQEVDIDLRAVRPDFWFSVSSHRFICSCLFSDAYGL
jgi:selenocysteine lyase/cysteine desulfurase